MTRSGSVVELALRRPVTTLMIFVTMLVLGAVTLTRIPLELVPSGFSPPFLTIRAELADATPADVERELTIPIERAVADTPGVIQISSSSGSNGTSIDLGFRGDVDMRRAYRDVRDRVARVRAELPAEVRGVTIRKQSGDSLPIAFYSVSWEPELADPRGVIDEFLVRPLQRVDGVALVGVRGPDAPQVEVAVDPDLAEAAGLDVPRVAALLVEDNFVIASGEVRSGRDRVLVRSMARWETLRDIERLPLPGTELRIADVAKVTLGPPPIRRYDRFSGRDAMIVLPIKESQANTVEVSERIAMVVAEATHEPQMQGVHVLPIFVQGEAIEHSLQQVFDAGWQGGALALVVLMFFLRRWRLTLLISLSIPVSLFLAIPVMEFSGQSINIVSLIGLMICTGLVVDNSVVVAENIRRHRSEGRSPTEAARLGAAEVALPLTIATATTVVVFLPAALLSEGLTQFFMVRMVTPVCVSLLASLFVALALIPLASARWIDTGESQATPRSGWGARWLDGLYRHTVGVVRDAYVRSLRWSLQHRADVVMAGALVMGSAVVPGMAVRCEPGQNLGTRNVIVRYVLPRHTSLEQADAGFSAIESELDRLRDAYPIDGFYAGFDADFGRVQIFFARPVPDEPPFKEMAAELVDRLPRPAGWDASLGFGDSDGARDDSFRVALYGDDHERVSAERERLETYLLGFDGVLGVRRGEDDVGRRDELALGVDRSVTERFGLTGERVARGVALGIRGAPVQRWIRDDGPVDVWVRSLDGAQGGVDGVLERTLVGDRGVRVELRQLVEPQVVQAQARRRRTDKRVGQEIRLDLEPARATELAEQLAAAVESYRLPEGMSFDAYGFQREVEDMQRDLFGALALGSVFIFLIMGFLFESVVLPLSVLPSIPLAFVGAWWFLYLTGETIDALAGIGMVLLVGVVVNNAIVLIDFVGQARAGGMDRSEAIVQAGELRFRPILMTALTTIGGILPLAFSEPTGEGIPYAAFGKALVGGMITATALTLLVVPVTYTLLDDARMAAARWVRRARA